MSVQPPKKIKLKIAVIGPPSSGKSSFISNMLSRPFCINYQKTVQYQLSLYKFSQNKTEYQIQLWECGCEHLSYNKYIRQAFFMNCSAAFLIFDLTDPKWKASVVEWLSEAYEFDCFLVYAIGTKKDLFAKKKYIEVVGQQYNSQQKLTDSLMERSGIQTLNELQINSFFQEYQVKHFYQQATEQMHHSIRNVFITLQNDQQKLTRSSLAVGRKFDNTVIDLRMVGSQRFNDFMAQSVQIEEFDSKGKNKKDQNQDQQSK